MSANDSPSELRAKGCICEFGCRNCGLPQSGMGNCPAWDPCPLGRHLVSNCPVHSE